MTSNEAGKRGRDDGRGKSRKAAARDETARDEALRDDAVRDEANPPAAPLGERRRVRASEVDDPVAAEGLDLDPVLPPRDVGGRGLEPDLAERLSRRLDAGIPQFTGSLPVGSPPAAGSAAASTPSAPGSAGAGAAAEFAALVRRLLALLGEDPERAGLRATPVRVANALTWLTRGYTMTAEQVVGQALFPERHEHMIMVRDIELYSLCEHHLLPFFGRAHIAYIPQGRIVGLSKLPRLVEVFARRLQVQERLTEEIATAVERVLAPRGVGVVLEAQHLCMMMRGVEKQNSKTITSALRGSFRSDAKTRDEFLRLAHGPV